MSVQLRIVVSDEQAETIRKMATAEKRSESNMGDVLLTEAIKAREVKAK
jgi:hypothetical protein